MAPKYLKEKKKLVVMKSGEIRMTNGERVRKLLEKLDLEGMKEWDQKYQEEAVQVMNDFEDIFALKEMEEIGAIRRSSWASQWSL